MQDQDRRTDAELVEAARKGDVESFRCLYERHYRIAIGIALSRLRDRHLAEDVVQEAFAIACRKLHTLSKTNRFPQWLGTICRRTASKMSPRQMHVEPLQEQSITDSSCETRGSRDEKVREAMEKLSVSARELLTLHYFSGLSYEEIALSLGISPQAVHGRLQRARKTLAIHLPNELKKGNSK
ncbi:RNA polymerase sigma factor [Pirellulaceae bacterium SH449]